MKTFLSCCFFNHQQFLQKSKNTLVALYQQHNETKADLLDFIEAGKQTAKTIMNRNEKIKVKKDERWSGENDVKKVKSKTKQKIDSRTH